MINYRILLRSLRTSTREYKDILRNGKSNRNIRSRVYKILKSNKDFSIIINTKISISE